MLIWIVRFCLGFATLALLAFSWRASLVVAICTLLEFFGMMMAGLPAAGFWSVARLMLGVGLLLGVVVSWSDQRHSYWELPLLALVTNLALAASWGSGLTGLGHAWPAYLATIVSLPIGILCTAAAVDVYRRERRRRAQRGV